MVTARKISVTKPVVPKKEVTKAPTPPKGPVYVSANIPVPTKPRVYAKPKVAPAPVHMSSVKRFPLPADAVKKTLDQSDVQRVSTYVKRLQSVAKPTAAQKAELAKYVARRANYVKRLGPLPKAKV